MVRAHVLRLMMGDDVGDLALDGLEAPVVRCLLRALKIVPVDVVHVG